MRNRGRVAIEGIAAAASPSPDLRNRLRLGFMRASLSHSSGTSRRSARHRAASSIGAELGRDGTSDPLQGTSILVQDLPKFRMSGSRAGQLELGCRATGIVQRTKIPLCEAQVRCLRPSEEQRINALMRKQPYLGLRMRSGRRLRREAAHAARWLATPGWRCRSALWARDCWIGLSSTLSGQCLFLD